MSTGSADAGAIRAAYASYRHQAVRDLAWSCFSSPLLNRLPGSNIPLLQLTPTEADLSWLAQLDQDPSSLHQALMALTSTRLGLYFEALWLFYWQAHPRWQLLGHNLQVHLDGKTLGAFDFLCKNPADEYYHIEHAVKFYLGVPEQNTETQPTSARHQWVGPNANDRLDIKLDHMLDQQLALGHTPAGRDLLNERFGAQNSWRPALCLRGYLFYPANDFLPPPSDAHQHHLNGQWWHAENFVQRHAGTEHDEHWIILERLRWLSPAQADDQADVLTTDALCAVLQARVEGLNQPTLVAQLSAGPERWEECSRHMIVPNHWPRKATPSRKT